MSIAYCPIFLKTMISALILQGPYKYAYVISEILICPEKKKNNIA